MTFRPPTPDRPLKSETLERHEFSSQSFVPVDVGRWLIVVAPHAAKGGPDMADARAFIANGQQGVTYKPDTWHHGLTTLDQPGRFAVFMWRAGTTGRGVRSGRAVHREVSELGARHSCAAVAREHVRHWKGPHSP